MAQTPKKEPSPSVDTFDQLSNHSPAPLESSGSGIKSRPVVSLRSPAHVNDTSSSCKLEDVAFGPEKSLVVKDELRDNKVLTRGPEPQDDDIKSESPLTSLCSSPSLIDSDSMMDEIESDMDLKDESESSIDTSDDHQKDAEISVRGTRQGPGRQVYVEVEHLAALLERERKHLNKKPGLRAPSFISDQDPVEKSSAFGSRFKTTKARREAPVEPNVPLSCSRKVFKTEKIDLTLDGGPPGRLVSADAHRPVKLEDNIPETKPDWPGLDMTLPETLKRRSIHRVAFYDVPADARTQSRTVKREPISNIFGGSTQSVRPRISRDRKHGHWNWLWVPDWYHPHAPMHPGEPGLLYSIGDPPGGKYYQDNDDEEKKDEVRGNIGKKRKRGKAEGDEDEEYKEGTLYHTFRGIKQGSGKWMYVGEYEFEWVENLSAREYSDLGPKFKKSWSDAILKGAWGRDVTIRALYGKEHGRLPTRAEHMGLICQKLPDFKQTISGRVTHEDITAGYEQGLEVITVALLKPINYLVQFQNYIADASDDHIRKKEHEKEAANKVDSSEEENSETKLKVKRKKVNRDRNRFSGTMKVKPPNRPDFSADESDDEVDASETTLLNLRKGTRSRPRF